MTVLACPRDHSELRASDGSLTCRAGHSYPLVDGIPVLVLDELEPTQPGYWATPEQIERGQATALGPAAGDVDPYVAEVLVGTHGNLYRGAEGALRRYPIPAFPLAGGAGRTLLDLGCNWGRWTLAAAGAGYESIGIDPSFEAVSAARRIAAQLAAPVRYAVADARALPFPDASLDVVFSYGVLQHFGSRDFETAVAEAARVLRPGGELWVQVASALGLRSLYQLARRRFRSGERFEVRYRRPSELTRLFEAHVGPAELAPEGFLTLNPQPGDLDLLRPTARAVVRVSESLRKASGRVPPLARLADSVSIHAVARSAPERRGEESS